MADTTFVDYSTVVPAAWLNDVNDLTYSGQFPLTTQSWAIGTTPLTYASQGVSGYIYNSANTGAVDSNALLRIHSVNRNANVQVIGGPANEGGFQALNQAGTFVAGFATQYSTGDWVWKTSPGGVATETLRLTQAGLLGVGTTAPFLKFTAANNTTDGTWAGSAGAISILGLGGYSNGTNGAAQFRYDRSSGVLSVQAGTRDTPVTRFSVTATGQLIGHTNVPWGTNSNGLTLALQGGDASSGSFATNGAAIALRGSATGFNDNGMEFYAGGGEKIRLDSTGLFTMSSPTSALGYGTGSGGAVTQLTSKSTTVTLNKANGLITMNAAALAAGATVAFNLSNNLLAVGDHVVANLNFATNSYDVKVFFVGATICAIAVKNITAGSLSEAVTIDFAIIKGSTS